MRNMDETRHATGIAGLDELIGGGIPAGTRTLVVGPQGAGKTVFALSFLWAGLRAGETVSIDVFDRPWPAYRRYFRSFGWDVEPYEKERRLIPVQAFPHFEPFERDPYVRYFRLTEFADLQEIDLELSRAGVSRFVFCDSFHGIFHMAGEADWHRVEAWTVNWCQAHRISNLDLIHTDEGADDYTRRLVAFTLTLANNIVRFRMRKEGGERVREMLIERMEMTSHPTDWLRVEISPHGMSVIP